MGGLQNGALGPSKFVTGVASPTASAVASEGDEIIEPKELILALAAFCVLERVPRGEIALHVFPFGGLSRALRLTSALRDGTWPALGFQDARGSQEGGDSGER